MKTLEATVRMVRGWSTAAARKPVEAGGQQSLSVFKSGIDDVLAALEGREQRAPLDEESMSKIKRALGGMPYGGLVMHHRLRDSSFVDDLVDYLNAFAVELVKVSAMHDSRERELRELQSQRAAFRAFIGSAE